MRENRGGTVVLNSYGRSSGFCIDPIEKKPLNHFLPGTPVLSFGTAGCNLACKFCQNWDISKSREMDTLASSATPEAIALSAEQHHCRSVAFTYNDPVIFMEYALDVAEACHEYGIKTVAVTAAYISEAARETFFRSIDAANIDLKAFTERFYRNITGSSLAPVLDNLRYLKEETEVWFEITNLIIPGENDDPAELHQMCAWIAEYLGQDVPLHFSAFHPDWKMPNHPQTPLATLVKARDIANEYGLNYVYTGNVHHAAGDTTFCPGCGQAVIVRDWYQLHAWHLDAGGHCDHCQHPIAGVFESGAGNWGSQRKRITIEATI